MKTVAVVGTFDTKGTEYAFLIEQLKKNGLEILTIDLGMMGKPAFAPDIPAYEVAKAEGYDLNDIRNKIERSDCLQIMANGASRICKKLCSEKKIDGIISMGGGQGTYMAGQIMREMPIGLPKLIISTVATVSECSSFFEGVNDTMIINSLVDISGLNPILQMIIIKSASAISCMVKSYSPFNSTDTNKIRIGISMWGVTTPCVNRIKDILSNYGYEVYVFHATGWGGSIMENLSEQKFFSGVIDITLPEVSNPVIGGEFVDIPYRLEKIGQAGIPYIVSLGGIDMVRFGKPFNLPDKFKGRECYMHNKETMFVRSSVEENIEVANMIAKKLNLAKGPVKVVIPLRGISAVDKKGNNMYDWNADHALFSTLKEKLSSNIEIIEKDAHINDTNFADSIADIMIKEIEKLKS